MKRILTLKAAIALIAMLSLMLAGQACNGPESEPTPGMTTNPTVTPEPTPEPTPEEEPWTGDYPRGVTVEEFTTDFGGGKFTKGITAVIDFKANPRLKFNTALAAVRKVPTQFFKDFNREKSGEPCICINAGYFAGSTSVSLCVIDGNVRSYSSRNVNWPNDEQYERTIYPVRSALGRMEDGSFEIQWNYCTDVGSKTQMAFPSTLGNDEKTRTFNDWAPSASVPGSFVWTPYTAVGGGPRLLKDGVDVAVDSYWGECLDAGGTAGLSRQPRTAAGITGDGKLILLVCDGRGMKGSVGMTLQEVAAKLKSMGAVQALNLDGGGSSQFVGFDGKIKNWPSDSGTSETIVERRIVTAILISELPKKQ